MKPDVLRDSLLLACLLCQFEVANDNALPLLAIVMNGAKRNPPTRPR